jgi:hypothetical protein
VLISKEIVRNLEQAGRQSDSKYYGKIDRMAMALGHFSTRPFSKRRQSYRSKTNIAIFQKYKM